MRKEKVSTPDREQHGGEGVRRAGRGKFSAAGEVS